MADGDFYTAPEHGWVCFHCGEHFPATHQGAHDARRHFGTTPDYKPGCQIKLFDNDRRLLRTIRILEAQVARYQHERLNEDSAKDREIHSMRADHAQALRREEELGYARGLRDGRGDSDLRRNIATSIDNYEDHELRGWIKELAGVDR